MILPEKEWEKIYEEIKSIEGVVIVLGCTDSGKSSLTKYLCKRFVEDHLTVSLVDSDVGQSALGLPGTISMKVFRYAKDVEDFIFERMSYVGTLNPATNIPLIINTTKFITEISRKSSAVTLLDTSGLVTGEIGKNLKINKINAIKPQYIIALQRESELEHILETVSHGCIRRLKVSHMARIRKREERINYRKKKFEYYFNKNRIEEYIVFQKKKTRFFYSGKLLNIVKSIDFPKGTIIGLNKDEETLSLGIISEIEDGAIIFRTPLRSLEHINKIIFGDIIFQNNIKNDQY